MNVIHLLTNADFTVNQYSEVLVPAGTVTINGESVTVGSDVIIPVGISSADNSSGTMYLIGKRKPESFKDVDGNYPFLGK